jgi:hypothetical protein
MTVPTSINRRADRRLELICSSYPIAFGKEQSMPRCTYCGGTEFYEGPSGGLSTNILCANKECRHWFNFTPFGMDDLKKVEPTEEALVIARAAVAKEKKAARLRRYNEGRAAFEEGKPIGSLRTTLPYGEYSEATDNIDSICGFIDALAEGVRGTSRGFTITDDIDSILGRRK